MPVSDVSQPSFACQRFTDACLQPPLYIDVRGNAGHAHPSPIEPVAGTDNLQRLRDLVDGVTLDITLRGLAAQDNATAPAMHVPRVRRAPFSECCMYASPVVD